MEEIIDITNPKDLPAGVTFLILENRDLALAQNTYPIYALHRSSPKEYTEYYVPNSLTSKNEEGKEE